MDPNNGEILGMDSSDWYDGNHRHSDADTNSSENRHDMEEKQIHQQRYADADLFYKKVLSDAFVDSIGQKNERGLNISPPFSVIFFYFSGKSYRTISQFFTPNAAYYSFVIS